MVTVLEKKVERNGIEQAAVEELRHRQRWPWSHLRAFYYRDGNGGGGGDGGACGHGRLLDGLFVVRRGPTVLAM
ncbi:hypothetical protein C1H46_012582 [Malus baccata]|uniref:Uncharacterized protein n=1 Tax=Malus baccata TaxID=106549 RepID=A0A540MSM1_MALBA|nr:hypothetical protein C1H46_012582 [Malus baccata]